MNEQSWTVRNAKAKLSEVLRKAREEGPQRIGERDTCVVVSEQEWLRLSQPKPHMGRWLIENMPIVEDLQLPSRNNRPRPNPFDHDA